MPLKKQTKAGTHRNTTMFANGPGVLGSIPGWVMPKTLKMVLETSLLNTQQYKVFIKGKVEQFRERSSALPYTLGVVAIEKGAFRSPLTMFANFTLLINTTDKRLFIFFNQIFPAGK